MQFRFALIACFLTSAVMAEESATAIDPLVRSSAYADKTVWSYHDSKPVPWALFKPKDFGSSIIAFDGTGVRSVGRVPAAGVHPRIFFSPEDLPEVRQRVKGDEGAQAAWKNLLAYCNALKLTYDEKADYANPNWMEGGFGIHGRVPLYRIGGYSPKRQNYYQLLADGQAPEKYAPATFYNPATAEALRCLIDDDAPAARTLAKAVITAVRLDQARRAKEDKPVEPGQPPKPSTPRANACCLGVVYDFLHPYMTPEQRIIVHDELVTLSAWADNYGTFNNAEASRSNWATFSYWAFDLLAIQGEPGFNDLKFLGLYRGWRNFFTYSFFDSGAAYEAEGKLLFGLEAAVGFDRIAPLYGLELLSHHPLIRSHYAKFTALSVLPTQRNYAIFDILGGMGGGLTTPQDLVVAHWLFPNDPTIDFVYRTTVGDHYESLPNRLDFQWNGVIASALFATSYNPVNVPEKLNLPLSFFCGQRSLMMTRSSWDRDATFLTMHVRGASGGHPYPDRGGIMFAGQGRAWVTIPYKDGGSWTCNTVVIDGASQNPTTPGRVVDFADGADATFMTGDASYCWDWVWATSAKNLDGKNCTRMDVDHGKVDLRRAWNLVDQDFNDFAFTKSERAIYQQPLKYNASWIGIDGILNPLIRQVNTPVLTSFRTAGLVRGARPYVLVVDDAQRDSLPTRYDWNLTLPADVVRVAPSQGTGVGGDIILAGKDSLGADGAAKAGEPALLIRVLEAQGRRLPDEVGLREKVNLLAIHTVAPSPNFKVLIYAFRVGDPLPTTVWDDAHRTVSVAFPGQQDTIACTPAASGRTDVMVSRGGRTIAALNRPVAPFADAATVALTERMRGVGARVEALRNQHFDPVKLPGFIAGWSLATTGTDGFTPFPGSAPTTPSIPLAEGTTVVEDSDGRHAAAIGKAPLTLTLESMLIGSGPLSLSMWVKTKPNPWFGRVLEAPGLAGFTFVQGNLNFSVQGSGNLSSWSSAMLSSWTHLMVTWDGTTIIGYRNGIPLTSDATPRKIKPGRQIRLGGADAYDNADTQVCDLFLFSEALRPQVVEDLYLWGRYATASH